MSERPIVVSGVVPIVFRVGSNTRVGSATGGPASETARKQAVALRETIAAQVHPKIAVAVIRHDDRWIIALNPALPRRARASAEAQARQYIDALESGWTYQLPAGGVDVPIAESLFHIGHAGISLGRTAELAVAVAAPLTALAATVDHAHTVVAPAVAPLGG